MKERVKLNMNPSIWLEQLGVWELGKTERTFWEQVTRLEYVAVGVVNCSNKTDGMIWIYELIQSDT